MPIPADAMTTTVRRPALCDIDVRRELRKRAAFAIAVLAVGLLLLTFATVLDVIAHARATRFESHAYAVDTYITKSPTGAYATFDHAPWAVPVVLNDPSEWHALEYTTVWVNRRDAQDVRIPTETKAFIGNLYSAQEAAVTIGVILLLVAGALGFVWLRKRRILSAHAWRSIAFAPTWRAREYTVEPDRVRYLARRLDLASDGKLQVAGPLEPASSARSIVRREASNRMYVVRGPLIALEWGRPARGAERIEGIRPVSG
jgi:hypothetical protein